MEKQLKEEKENYKSTVTVTELNSDSANEENKNEQTERSHKISDDNKVKFALMSRSLTSDKGGEVICLPEGYIKMRDVT